MKEGKKHLVCLLCRNFIFDAGSAAWSEVTPGTDWCCRCGLNHFYMGGDTVSEKEYRDNLLKADTCIDYDEVE